MPPSYAHRLFFHHPDHARVASRSELPAWFCRHHEQASHAAGGRPERIVELGEQAPPQLGDTRNQALGGPMLQHKQERNLAGATVMHEMLIPRKLSKCKNPNKAQPNSIKMRMQQAGQKHPAETSTNQAKTACRARATHQSIEPPAGVSVGHGCVRHCAALQAPDRAAPAACSAKHLSPPAG